jgi:hypothetical protein
MERYRRNDTEAFAAKYITPEDLLHIMRQIRLEEGNGECTAFRKAVVEELEKKAQVYRQKLKVAAKKKKARDAALHDVGVERSRTVVNKMTVCQLKEQYDVYKFVVKDTTILKTTLASIPKRVDKLATVLAVLDRYERCVM